MEGAEGKDHLVSAKTAEVKNVLIGSLAGPESPLPWSHSMKLRAIGPGSGCLLTTKEMVVPRVNLAIFFLFSFGRRKACIHF